MQFRQTRSVTRINRFTKLGISTMAAASVASGAFALASTGAASAATRAPAAHASACGVSARNYPLPKAPTAFRAGSAGSVAVATVNAGTIRVAGIHPAPDWRAYVDSSSGSSVDVYFHSVRHSVKFEAEINDAGGLTVTITSC